MNQDPAGDPAADRPAADQPHDHGRLGDQALDVLEQEDRTVATCDFAPPRPALLNAAWDFLRFMRDFFRR